MATFNTVWSLDIGRSSLKAVRLRREKNNIEILEVDKVDYTTGTDGVDSAEQAKEALSAFRTRNEVRDPVIVAHNGQGTLSRFIKVPAFEPKKVKEMVGYEAAQQIPFPLDEVIWDHHVIDRDYAPGEEREVGIFAARRDAIDDYLVDFEAEELSVEGVTIGYLGLLNFILYDIAPAEPTIFLDIGASHTDLILVDGRKFWTRALPHSGNDINKSIMQRFRLSFAEAEKVKVQSAKNPQQAAKVFTAVVQPKLRELVNEIHRSIGYYRSQHGEVQFTQLYLLGNGSKILGLKKFLQEHLDMPVHRLQGISRLRISRDANVKLLKQNLPAFGTAFGAALQGVGVGSCRVDLLPKEERLQKEFNRKKKHVYIALAALYLVTLLAGFLIDQKARKAADDAQALAREASRIDTPNKELREIQETDVSKQTELLEGIAIVRNKPVEVLNMLGQVLSTLPLARYESLVSEDDAKREEKTAALRQASLALMEEKVWISWFEMTKVFYPESEKPGSAADELALGKVPAYRVTLFAAVRAQDTQEASLRLIRQRVQDPVKARLRTLSNDRDVEIGERFQNLDQILHTPASASPAEGRRRFGARDADPQEGGPFFGTLLKWYMRVDDPVSPPAEVAREK